MSTLENPTAEAERIIDAANSKKIVLRLFGGTAFFFRCPSAKHRSLTRNYVDVDFMGHYKQSREIKRLILELGYVGRDKFNAMQGHKRLIFNDVARGRRVDVFLDVFEMCHKFNFKDRLEIDSLTIPLADMLATKLQIVEVSEKDMKDILSVLLDYDVGTTDTNLINGAYLAKLCANDWGIYKTFTLNLDRIVSSLPERNLDAEQEGVVKSRVNHLQRMIDESPKSMGWKMRARIGEKVTWYLLPEADREVVDSRVPTGAS